MKLSPVESSSLHLAAEAHQDTEQFSGQELPTDENLDSPLQISTRSLSAGISRDEMNLAEFPLTVLSTRSNPNVKTLEFSDTIYHRSGKPIQRRWVITGADKFGLPTSSDDEVLLGLVKLSVQNAFKDRKVFFTRYELLKSLKWSTEGRSYLRLQNALDRLSGVRIKASNAFFDNDSKAHSTRNFGLLDAYEINDGRDANNKESFFVWSEVLFKSFQAGFVKKLDLDFYLSLSSAVSKRLYRYLDKHFWYRSTISINLFTLCHEKLGISRNYKYQSMLRQQLDPAAEELMKQGFLSEVRYSGKGKSTEVHFVSRTRAPRKNSANRTHQDQNSSKVATQQKNSVFSDPQNKDEDNRLSEWLGQQLRVVGMGDSHIRTLLQRRQESELKRMKEVFSYIEERYLREGAPRKVSNPAGLLFRSLKDPFVFVLPTDSKKNHKFNRALHQDPTSTEAMRGGTPTRKSAEKQDTAVAKKQYELFLLREVSRLKQETDESLLESMRQEIADSLRKMRSIISEQHFSQVVEHRLGERLVQLFAVHSFEDWLREVSSKQ